MDYEKDHSIVICTYNPDVRLLERCLAAVARFDTSGLRTEVILIDNNSRTPVASLPFIQALSSQIPNFKLIVEKEQGLKYARLTAISAACGKVVVFLDDDNEAAPDYLRQLSLLNQRYPNVAAWGPGDVEVDFVDGIDPKIADRARPAFQERHTGGTHYAAETEWQACYPFGTGLCIQTSLLKEYLGLSEAGELTLTGRTGRTLASGEDTQMIMLGIRKGYAAGTADTLRIKHLIPGNRANLKFLERLAWGTTVCYETCLLEIFPERKARLLQTILPGEKFSRQALKKTLRASLSRSIDKKFELIGYLSTQSGIYRALDKPLPPVITRLIKFLQLE